MGKAIDIDVQGKTNKQQQTIQATEKRHKQKRCHRKKHDQPSAMGSVIPEDLFIVTYISCFSYFPSSVTSRSALIDHSILFKAIDIYTLTYMQPRHTLLAQYFLQTEG